MRQPATCCTEHGTSKIMLYRNLFHFSYTYSTVFLQLLFCQFVSEKYFCSQDSYHHFALDSLMICLQTPQRLLPTWYFRPYIPGVKKLKLTCTSYFYASFPEERFVFFIEDQLLLVGFCSFLIILAWKIGCTSGTHHLSLLLDYLCLKSTWNGCAWQWFPPRRLRFYF